MTVAEFLKFVFDVEGGMNVELFGNVRMTMQDRTYHPRSAASDQVIEIQRAAVLVQNFPEHSGW